MLYSWALIDPDGKRHEVDDLAKWSQDNVKLFFPDAAPDNAAARISEGVQMLWYALKHPERPHGLHTYKGWTLAEPPQPKAPKAKEPKKPLADRLIGKTFGDLSIVGTAPAKIMPNGYKCTMVVVHCALCGNDRIMSYNSLKISRSCGCQRGRRRKDGLAPQPVTPSRQPPYDQVPADHKGKSLKKICAICGKPFYASPSDVNQQCCSKKCSAALRVKNGHINNAAWSDEAKARRAADPEIQARMQTLQSIGTSAALELPAGQKGPQNREALVWQLIDPDGNTHKAVNLLDWARKNHLLFFDEDVPEDVAAKRIAAGFRAVATSIRGTRSRSRSASSYKGWMLAGLPTPKTADDDNFDNTEDTMRKIINGSRYDTDTAKKMAHWESDQDYTGLTHCEETLYRTKAGKWFIHGTGNAATVYAVRRGDEWTAPGEQIVPLSEEVARIWVLEHLGEEQRDAIFGTGSEDTKDVQATVYIPGPLAEKMAARIDAEQCNRNELILQALREYLK
jgi:hypothetical protein